MSELTKRDDETQTQFTIRVLRHEAWEQGWDAAYGMARSWGHVDGWEGPWPSNPFAAPPPTDDERAESAPEQESAK